MKETDLYIICAIFIAGTLAWYTLFRMRPSVWVLSAPWVVFACAFMLIGFPSLYGPFTAPRVSIQRVSVWLYSAASSAGFLFFGLNFGDEAGAATEIWVTRACIVQGLQQIWGESRLSRLYNLVLTFQFPHCGTGDGHLMVKTLMPLSLLELSFSSLGHLPPCRSRLPP